MDLPFADMHVHSYFSDSSMSPEEIARSAWENGVGLLAVADHDVVEGSSLLREACKDYGIYPIPAVEIDTLDGDQTFHVLAYRFQTGDRAFLDFLGHTRFLLDEMSVKLVEALQADFPCLCLADYMDFAYDRRLGGWRALHYLMEKGLTRSLKEGIGFYRQYHITYEKAGFASVAATCRRIRRAGGRSVLAHPGELIDTTDMDRFERELRRLAALGLEGIECYYPSHSAQVTETCLRVCREKNLLVTAGSDCHGTFGKTRIGEMDIPARKLVLQDLLSPSI